MADKPERSQSVVQLDSTNEGVMVAKAVAEGFEPGKAPLKVVTGNQTTSRLSFNIKPGAIVAHPGSSVIFVCG